jgi:hypothetical protein
MYMSPISSTGFSDSELQTSYWLASHRLLLYRLGVVGLVLLALLFWGYSFWQVISIARAYPYEQQQLRSLLTSQNGLLQSLEARRPAPITFGNSQIISSGAITDTLTTISNSNSDWAAQFTYSWSQSGQSLVARDGFILPGETKYLVGLALPANSQLQVDDITWQRIPNFLSIRDERLKFRLVEQQLIQGALATDPSVISFSVANDSAYSYWEVGLQVLMYSGPNIIGVEYIVVDQFKAGTTRTFQLPTTRRLSQNPSLQVVPDVDILDQDNLMSPEAIDISPIDESLKKR